MTQIQEVSPLHRGRVRIILDNGDRYDLLKSALLDRPLREGDEVDPEEFSRWVTLRQYRSALDKAVTMLAARACSQGEIEEKLRRAGYAPETIEMVIYKLESNDLLDDQAFAEQWVQSRTHQKYGPRRIQQELRRKGVSAEETEAALSGIPEEEQLENAVSLAEKALARARAGEDPRKSRQRILQALVRRGFDWDIARQAIERIMSESD